MSNNRQSLSLQIIRDENWVDRYVQKRLSVSETEAFEQFMLDSPEVQDEVLAVMTLQQGLPHALREIEKSKTGVSWLSSFMGSGLQPAMGLVGSALAVTFAVLFVMANSEINQLEDQVSALQGPQGDIATAYLPRVRSADTAAFEPVAVMPAKSSGWALLQLELDYAEADRFNIAIRTWRDEQIVTTVSDVRRSADDLLTVAVPAIQLPAGEYVAVVQSNGQQVAEFPFSVE